MRNGSRYQKSSSVPYKYNVKKDIRAKDIYIHNNLDIIREVKKYSGNNNSNKIRNNGQDKASKGLELLGKKESREEKPKINYQGMNSRGIRKPLDLNHISQKEYDKLKEENKTLNENIKLYLEEKNKLIDTCKKFESENQNLKYDIRNVGERNKILVIQIQELKSQLLQKDKKISQLEEEIKTLKSESQGGLYYKTPQDNRDLKVSKNIKTQSPILIGLSNIGATCFMNSAIQCLSQTIDLTNYFLDENNKNMINSLSNKNQLLSPYYLELINQLWDPNENKPISPNKFRDIIWRIGKTSSSFQMGEPNDAKDLILFILDNIHKELKMQVFDKKTKKCPPLNQFDEENTWQNFIKFQNESGKSIISDLFFGISLSKKQCFKCKKIIYTYQNFNFINFPLNEVRNYIQDIYSQNRKTYNKNYITLYDCFDYYEKKELYNENLCQNCKWLYDAESFTQIYEGPKNLILVLDRGYAKQYNINIIFDEIMDLSEYIINKGKKKILYHLYGVITHLGKSGRTAHFVAFCRSQINQQWYLFDDSKISDIDDFQNQILPYGTHYVLFYQKES